MIHARILQTIGGKENFTLYVDDVKYSKYTLTNSSYIIRGLNPGQRYKIQATTTFCSFESVMTDPVEECTGMTFLHQIYSDQYIQGIQINISI